MRIAIVLSLTIILSQLGLCQENNRYDYWNQILQKTLPTQMQDMYVITEKDLTVYRYYGRNNSLSEGIYKDTLSQFNSGELSSIREGDINGNGYVDIALAVTNGDKKHYMIVILEKKNSEYRLKKTISFNTIFLMAKIVPKAVPIIFQVQTDWVGSVLWNGKDYVYEELEY